MKLLLVHRFIRPDSPGYAHMLYIMGRSFAANGHDVTIFSAQPSYNESYAGEKLPRKQIVDGMTVIRTPLLKESKKNTIARALNFLIFTISLFCHAVFRWKSYDLMTVTTFPPAIMGFVARAIGWFRKTGYVYHCMDLYPEVAETSGILKRGLLSKLAAAVDAKNCQSAKAVVVLSEDMEKTVRQRGVTGSHINVINNFIIDDLDELIPVPESLQNPKNRFRVIFAGNIGRFQNLETIIAAAKELKDEDAIEFWFVGSGVMEQPLKQQAGELLDKSVFFHPYVSIDTIMGVIAKSHLGVISLAPGVVDCAYPSKTMTYVECGCRLLTLVEPESELAQFVQQEDLGVVLWNESPEQMANVIRQEFQRWTDHGVDRTAIRDVGRRYFGRDQILGKWKTLLSTLDSDQNPQGEG